MSILYRVHEPFPDALSALLRARAIMRDLADVHGRPWLQLEAVGTREQYLHAVRTFSVGRFAGDLGLPSIGPFLAELPSLGIAFERRKSSHVFMADVPLRPELADLWPLPEGMELILSLTPPFGAPGREPEDVCTEEDLDRMVAALGPLTLNASWNCSWRGVPDFKGSGVQLCLNSVWGEQYAESAPGEYGVWVSLGARATRTPEAQAWLRDSGLLLGEPQLGW